MGATAKTLNETRRALDRAINETVELQRRIVDADSECAFLRKQQERTCDERDEAQREVERLSTLAAQATARAIEVEARLDRIRSIAGEA